MAKTKKDYFKLSPVVSLILAIIPITAWVLGVVTRWQEGHKVCAIIRIFTGWGVWVADLVFMILKGHILRLF